MTRLISNSTRSRRAASTDGGTGAPAPTTELPDGVLPDGVSSGVLAALVTWLPGPADPRPSAAEGRRREACPSTASVLQVPKGRLCLTQTRQDARAHLCRERRSLLAWIPRRAAPPVAARRPFFSGPSRAPAPHALRPLTRSGPSRAPAPHALRMAHSLSVPASLRCLPWLSSGGRAHRAGVARR